VFLVGGPIRARLEIINYYITLITCFIMIHIWWLVINDSWTNELLQQFLARLISYRFEVIARVHAVKNAIFRGFIPHRLWVIAYSNKLDQLIRICIGFDLILPFWVVKTHFMVKNDQNFTYSEWTRRACSNGLRRTNSLTIEFLVACILLMGDLLGNSNIMLPSHVTNICHKYWIASD